MEATQTSDQLMLFAEASRSCARTFLSPERAQVLAASAVAYGRSSPELLARYDRGTSSSKMLQTSEADLPPSSDGLTVAYVAGLIDGEGCLYIVKRKKWFYPRLDLAMADKALPLLQKLHHQFGGSLNLHRKVTERWDGAHRWALMGKPLRELLTNCLPFLQLKKRQAELCLNLNPADAETIRALLTELNRKGPPVTPEAGWFARHVGDRWLTPQQNFIEPTGFTEFSETWPRSGLMRNGTAYQLPPLVRLTDGTGSGLLPTMRSGDGAVGNLRRKEDVERTGHKGRLEDYVVMWPTPTNRDYRSGVNHNCWYNARPLSEIVGGTLNPTWVEWLMGFPLGWTDCGPSETRSSRKSRKSSDEQS
jgi:hypothetical protein